jgi:hypothetical protein
MPLQDAFSWRSRVRLNRRKQSFRNAQTQFGKAQKGSPRYPPGTGEQPLIGDGFLGPGQRKILTAASDNCHRPRGSAVVCV